MRTVRSCLIGFLVSFAGSVPLGYLNVVGLQIYESNDFMQLLYYLCGVLLIEGTVIFLTLKLAHKLDINPYLKKKISIFSVFFLLFMALYFYLNSGSAQTKTDISNYVTLPFFFVGIILSLLNVAQLPFWMFWNTYLMNQNYIDNGKKTVLYYLFGTVLGAFGGMIAFIFGIKEIVHYNNIHPATLSKLFPLVFIVLAIVQLFQMYRSRRRLQ